MEITFARHVRPREGASQREGLRQLRRAIRHPEFGPKAFLLGSAGCSLLAAVHACKRLQPDSHLNLVAITDSPRQERGIRLDSSPASEVGSAQPFRPQHISAKAQEGFNAARIVPGGFVLASN